LKAYASELEEKIFLKRSTPHIVYRLTPLPKGKGVSLHMGGYGKGGVSTKHMYAKQVFNYGVHITAEPATFRKI